MAARRRTTDKEDTSPLATSTRTRTKSGASKTAAKSSGASKPAAKSAAKSATKKTAKTKKPAIKKTAAKKPTAAAGVIASGKPRTAAQLAKDNATLRVILSSLDEMKAEDTVTIDLADKQSIGEIMVVATGRSNVHIASIADRVVKDLKKHDYTGIAVEGLRQGDWVLIDAGSVIVHLFRPEVRTFYSIEKMWSA